MRETQESISAWAEETFGSGGSNARVAARANEELSELIRALSADDGSPKASEEAADVVIVLYRLAARMGFQLNEPRPGIVFTTSSNLCVAAHAAEAMSLALIDLALSGDAPRVAYYVGRVALILSILADRLGSDLDAEIDAKMARNRSQTWNMDGTGCGYHVRDQTTA